MRIPTLIPPYDEMLAAASTAVAAVESRSPVVVDLGIGSGALAARCVASVPRARLVGIDTDEGMLALARKRLQRLGDRVDLVPADFLSAPLPRCDVVTASFSLHHIPTRRRKAALYGRCFKAIRAGGLLVNADCCLASNAALQAQDRRAWLRHLERSYTPARARGFLRAWAHEDVYFRLEDEIAMMRAAGFTVDVPWRRHSFAVIVGTKSGGVDPCRDI
ncbi:MAG: class I SAM-dependent methyltransferase [Acidobacteria bacterium]|nr:class I SAM-dependent methyltransferase [Acidobacteriota bacterium]